VDFKIIYKLDITIVEDKFYDGKSPQELKDNESLVKKPNGQTCIVSGNVDKIKRDICKQIDKLSEDLKKWYYGGDED